MKTWILTLAAAAVIGWAAFAITRHSPAPASTQNAATEPPIEAKAEPSPRSAERKRPQAPLPITPGSVPPSEPAAATSPIVETTVDEAEAFRRAIDALVSPTATYQDKWAAWKKLREEGRLDDVIDTLKQRQAEQPESALVSSALGIAYLLNAGTKEDAREKGINGLSADRSFDEALKLDPKNWEAQYWKAYGMTYWPADMKKGPEILDRLTSLVKQQEAVPTQDHFARAYLLLGDQYQKADYAAEARQVWERGAAFFPSNPELKSRLAAH